MDKFLASYKNYLLKSVPENKKYLMQCYIDFILLAVKSAYNKQIKYQIKIKKFDLLYRQIFKNCIFKNNIIHKLQQQFVKENISLSLMTDIIKACKYSADDSYGQDNKHRIYCMEMFVGPLARFIMVLNNLNMSVYIPFVALMMGAALVSMYQHNNITDRKFYTNKLNGFLKDAKILPMLIQNRILRFKICYFLMLSDAYIGKIKRKEQLKITIIDLVKILLYALTIWLFTRVRTLNVRGV